MQSYVKGGLELGRSFVQPKYWGMRSLDYLWQGIGAYLAAHQQVQYLFGPVSLSSSLPKSARDMVAYFYTIHFPDPDRLAVATHPYVIDPATKAHLQKKMPGQELATDQDWLREQLGFMGLKIPTLFLNNMPMSVQLAVSGFVVSMLIRRSIIVLMVWLWLICAI